MRRVSAVPGPLAGRCRSTGVQTQRIRDGWLFPSTGPRYSIPSHFRAISVKKMTNDQWETTREFARCRIHAIRDSTFVIHWTFVIRH
jgi:hypothetical protein